jgi:hypothetical protein
VFPVCFTQSSQSWWTGRVTARYRLRRSPGRPMEPRGRRRRPRVRRAPPARLSAGGLRPAQSPGRDGCCLRRPAGVGEGDCRPSRHGTSLGSAQHGDRQAGIGTPRPVAYALRGRRGWESELGTLPASPSEALSGPFGGRKAGGQATQ